MANHQQRTISSNEYESHVSYSIELAVFMSYTRNLYVSYPLVYSTLPHLIRTMNYISSFDNMQTHRIYSFLGHNSAVTANDRSDQQ
jgi:hypothetical protein